MSNLIRIPNTHLSTPVKSKLNDIKNEYGLPDINAAANLLLDLVDTKSYIDKKGNKKDIISGRAKVENTIKIWLHSKPEQKITASELRKFTQVDLNSCNSVMSTYSERIRKHNLNILPQD